MSKKLDWTPKEIDGKQYLVTPIKTGRSEFRIHNNKNNGGEFCWELSIVLLKTQFPFATLLFNSLEKAKIVAEEMNKKGEHMFKDKVKEGTK